MSGPLKYHPHGSVLFVTFSLEEGLLLLCNPLCQAILKSCLARAQFLYPIDVSHLIVEATHVHLLTVVRNPEDVPAFIRHFKTESAHMLNAILGREKRTVWCEGYDSPVVLTLPRALLAIAYIYSNPSKDNLEESIDRYPGLSSWKMFQMGGGTKVWKRLRRFQFNYLTRDSHNLRGYTKEAERLLGGSNRTHEFKLKPNAWLEAFGIFDPAEQRRLNASIVAHVRALEQRASLKRDKEGKSVIGRGRLMRQVLDIYHRPKRSGRRMWCLSEDRKLRIEFINFIKCLAAEARRIRKKWKLGDFSEPYPLGLYPPSLPKLAEPIFGW